MLASLRALGQLMASLVLVLGAFMVIPAGELFQRTLPDNPQVRVLRLAPTPDRHRVPRLDDEGLEAALEAGVRGARSRAVRDELRLWAHRQIMTRTHPEVADPAPDTAVWDSVQHMMASSWPVSPRFRVTSRFGMRTHPTLGGRRFHRGVDLGVPHGTPVHAVLDGQVARAEGDAVNGLYVVLDHGEALASVYCHNSEIAVIPAELVEQDQLIALSGATGRATGPHLHYGLRIGPTWVDPLLVRRLQRAAWEAREGAVE
ncbi:MAG: M23 family metallopeptidase [Pseudomonadota bacterium]